MMELLGCLICGFVIGMANVLSGKLPPQRVALNVGLSMIGVLLTALALHLRTMPADEVRALLGKPTVALSFFFALVSAFCYLSIQIITPVTPKELLSGLLRWSDRVLAAAGALTILGLASADLSLSIYR